MVPLGNYADPTGILQWEWIPF